MSFERREDFAAPGGASMILAMTTRSKRAEERPIEPEASPPAEYTIDELARAAQTTVRNVRAYQDRRLLPPPERRGRIGIYSDVHLARLRLIGQALARGYSLANIDEMLSAWEQGQDVGQILGLEAAITSPWSDEVPGYFTTPELVEKFGGAVTASALEKITRLEILVPDGGRFRAPSPRMIHAGAELVAAGVPLDELLDVVAAMRTNVEEVADRLVRLVVVHVFDPLGEDRLPPASEAPRLAELVWRLRPLAKMAVNSEVARAMERSATRFLGERLSHVLEHLRGGSAGKGE